MSAKATSENEISEKRKCTARRATLRAKAASETEISEERKCTTRRAILRKGNFAKQSLYRNCREKEMHSEKSDPEKGKFRRTLAV